MYTVKRSSRNMREPGTFESMQNTEEELGFVLVQKQYYESRGETVPDWIIEALEQFRAKGLYP